MEYIDLKPSDKSEEMFNQLAKGAFFTTMNSEKINTMTIAWGGINVVWGKIVYVAYVRYSRDSYEMMNNTDEFTISLPLNGQLKRELGFCGTKSGRNIDKFKECNFTPVKGRNIETPVIKECDLHYECKVIYRQAMEPNNIPESALKRYYTNNDFHVIFYGEILDSYLIKGE